MKKIYYILFILPFLFFTDVFAIEVDVTSTITSPSSPTQGRYSGTEIYNTGTENVYNVNTRYNGRLSRIRYNLPISGWLGECYTTNQDYTITMYMSTEDWRNRFGSVSVSAYGHEYSSSSVTYVSYKKIYFKFKIPASTTNCIDYVFIDLKSTNISSTAFTGDSNWNLSKITITDPNMSSSGGSGGNTTPTPTPTSDFSDITNNQNQNTNRIINNQNQNTQDIIDNNNSNTEDIINNQNQNTEQLIDSQKTCTIIPAQYDSTKGKYLNSDGTLISNSSWSYSDYIKVAGGTMKRTGHNSGVSPSLCFYDVFKNLISCTPNYLVPDDVVFPDNTFYIRASFDVPNNIPIYQLCFDGNQSISDGINDVNKSINNSSIDDKTGFFSDFNNDNHGLTGIITLPLTTIQGLANNSCVSLSVPIPYTNSNISLPCMTEVYQTYVPSVFSIWRVVSFGIISYLICLDIFKMVKGFKDPNEDKIEVLDL